MVPSLSGVKYVFLARPFGEGRQRRVEELTLRCFVARGLEPAARAVIGIATERPEPGKGHSLDALYLDKPEWTEEDQRNLELVQEELGYFAAPAAIPAARFRVPRNLSLYELLTRPGRSVRKLPSILAFDQSKTGLQYLGV